MTVGEMLRSFLTKLEWFSTLFPRIPVPVQKTIDQQMKNRPRKPPQKEGKEEEEDGDWHRSRYITESSSDICLVIVKPVRVRVQGQTV